MSGVAAGLLLVMGAEVSDLTLAYGESSRPRVCAPAPSGADVAAPASGASAWDRVRRQPVEQLCLGLARSQIRLERDPAGTLTEATRMAADWPGRPEPLVLAARAQLRLGDAAASWRSWELARGLGSDGGAEPRGDVSAAALRDAALAAVLTGHEEIALGIYRRLVSLLDAWPDRRHVQRLYLEAAAAALRAGPDHFDEAAGYVSGAQVGATSTALRAYAAGMLALLDARRGAPGRVAGGPSAPEIWRLVELVRAKRALSYWPVLRPGEAEAIASLLVEAHSALDAAELWDVYVSRLTGDAAPAAELLKFARERQQRLRTRAGGAR